MIRTLDEAIKHCEEKAKKNKRLAKTYESFKDYGNPKTDYKKCLECAAEHEQLAALLTELQERREADRWIPVSERLPEEDADYEITLRNKQVTIDHAVDGKFMFHNGDVIAWKPLSKPYESEDK